MDKHGRFIISETIEGLIGVLCLHIGWQVLFGEFCGYQLLLQATIFQYHFQLGLLFTKHSLDDTISKIGGKALIEPKISPGGITDKVSSPGVSQLMSHGRHQTLVSSDQSRRNKCQARVFHATKGKTRWQDYHVITPPGIRPQQRLGDFYHQLGIFKLFDRRI